MIRDGLERTDILAVQAGGNRRMVEIQVKAASDNGRRTNWMIGEKAQQPARSDREWFAFVMIPQNVSTAPRTFLIPRDHVAAAAWIYHQAWATDPSVPVGRRNAPHSQARVFVEAWERYEDKWGLLKSQRPRPRSCCPAALASSHSRRVSGYLPAIHGLPDSPSGCERPL